MGRLFQAKGTSSKVLMGNVLGVVRSSKADVAGVERACEEGAGNEGGEKARARPYGPLARIRTLDFILCVIGRPGKVWSKGLTRSALCFKGLL